MWHNLAMLQRSLLTSLALCLLAACGESSTNSAAPAGAGGAGGSEGAGCPAAEIEKCTTDQKSCKMSGGAATCEPCPAGQFADDAGACKPLVGQKFSNTFPDFTTQPGEEVSGLCRSWTLGNETELWVNAVELEQNEASHHSNWTFTPEDTFPGPDGTWKCKERGYNQLSAALAGGVIYAQSTQATREVQKFPDGVAVRIPPRSRIISDVHILNTSEKAITGHITFGVYAVPVESVKVKLAPFHLVYDGLAIPPRASSRFTGECELDSHFQKEAQTPLSMKVYYLLPHTHSLGRRFFLEAVGGPSDGKSLIDVRGYNGEARGRRYGPPIDLAGAKALRFGCEFENPRDDVIHYGIGDQEMCEVLGFAESPIAFESSVNEAKEDGVDGAIKKFTGACSTAAFLWGRLGTGRAWGSPRARRASRSAPPALAPRPPAPPARAPPAPAATP